MINALLIAAGSLVGMLSLLGLVVVVRVVTMGFRLKRAMRNAPDAFAARQHQLNAAQTALAKAQRTLAAQKRAAAHAPAPKVRP